MKNAQAPGVGVAATALLASTATLLCCVLPAVMVALGAGAALVGVVAAFPQLVWLSEHKLAVFAVAGVLLVVAGAFLAWARRQPCPIEPDGARKCLRLRRLSHVTYGIAVLAYAVGALFAWLLPSILRAT